MLRIVGEDREREVVDQRNRRENSPRVSMTCQSVREKKGIRQIFEGGLRKGGKGV